MSRARESIHWSSRSGSFFSTIPRTQPSASCRARRDRPRSARSVLAALTSIARTTLSRERSFFEQRCTRVWPGRAVSSRTAMPRRGRASPPRRRAGKRRRGRSRRHARDRIAARLGPRPDRVLLARRGWRLVLGDRLVRDRVGRRLEPAPLGCAALRRVLLAIPRPDREQVQHAADMKMAVGVVLALKAKMNGDAMSTAASA